MQGKPESLIFLICSQNKMWNESIQLNGLLPRHQSILTTLRRSCSIDSQLGSNYLELKNICSESHLVHLWLTFNQFNKHGTSHILITFEIYFCEELYK